MRINFAKNVQAPPEAIISSAESWLTAEGIDAPITHATRTDGARTVGVEQLQDGIVIATEFAAVPAGTATRVEFTIRMYGTSFGSKVRNLGMLPMVGIVRKEAARQFQEFVSTLESTR